MHKSGICRSLCTIVAAGCRAGNSVLCMHSLGICSSPCTIVAAGCRAGNLAHTELLSHKSEAAPRVALCTVSHASHRSCGQLKRFMSTHLGLTQTPLRLTSKQCGQLPPEALVNVLRRRPQGADTHAPIFSACRQPAVAPHSSWGCAGPPAHKQVLISHSVAAARSLLVSVSASLAFPAEKPMACTHSLVLIARIPHNCFHSNVM